MSVGVPMKAVESVADLSLSELAKLLADFASDRNWQKFHTPRNLAGALVAEVGELFESFLWMNDEQIAEASSELKAAIGDELADVLIYLVRLSDVVGVDLTEAVITKFEKNGRRYPAQEVWGSSAKRP
jgi:NTP pyrophosphatase (non-canonical NTP hydrolase)